MKNNKKLFEDDKQLLTRVISSSNFRLKLEEEIQLKPENIKTSNILKDRLLFDFFKKQYHAQLKELNNSLQRNVFIGEVGRRREQIKLSNDMYSKIFKISKSQLIDFFEGRIAVFDVKIDFIVDLLDFFSIPFRCLKKAFIDDSEAYYDSQLSYSRQTNYYKNLGTKQTKDTSICSKSTDKLSIIKERLIERKRNDLL